jgi:hypothetical protein
MEVLKVETNIIIGKDASLIRILVISMQTFKTDTIVFISNAIRL